MQEAGRTEDLKPNQPAPPEPTLEDRMQRWGRCNYWAGGTVLIGTALTTLTVAILSDQRGFTSADGKLFAQLTCIILAALGATLIVVGGTQTVTAHLRAAVADVRTDIERNRKRLEQVASEVHDNDLTVRSHFNAVLPLVPRFDRMEQRLGDIEAAISAIAEHLPDVLKSENWRGFNAAVKEGFTGQQTGTEELSRRRPPHIGLVPPGDSGGKP